MAGHFADAAINRFLHFLEVNLLVLARHGAHDPRDMILRLTCLEELHWISDTRCDGHSVEGRSLNASLTSIEQLERALCRLAFRRTAARDLERIDDEHLAPRIKGLIQRMLQAVLG